MRAGLAEMTAPIQTTRVLPDVPPSLVGAIAGGALLALGVHRRGIGGTIVGLFGAGLLAANIPPLADELIEAGTRRNEIGLRETLVFDRPVAELFAFCSNFENFTQVVPSLVKVVDFDDGRSRWTVRSPSGRLIEWDAVVTKYLPQQVIAWESVPGSAVRHSGLVRFRSEAPNRTRVDLTIRYVPSNPTTADAIAALFGPRRSARLRTDLARVGGQPLRNAAE